MASLCPPVIASADRPKAVVLLLQFFFVIIENVPLCLFVVCLSSLLCVRKAVLGGLSWVTGIDASAST